MIDIAGEIGRVIRLPRDFVDARRVGRWPFVITMDIANHSEFRQLQGLRLVSASVCLQRSKAELTASLFLAALFAALSLPPDPRNSLVEVRSLLRMNLRHH